MFASISQKKNARIKRSRSVFLWATHTSTCAHFDHLCSSKFVGFTLESDVQRTPFERDGLGAFEVDLELGRAEFKFAVGRKEPGGCVV